MTQPLKYTATNDSVTIIWAGAPVTVKRGASNFENLRKACMAEDWDEVRHHVRPDSSIERWAKGKFKVNNAQISYNGKDLPDGLNERIVNMSATGEDPTPLMKFWERLQANPSKRSVDQLWNFLKNTGIPLTSDGFFLAYKAVRHDFKDVHSNTIDNSVGKVITMPRNEISDDPNHACHEGLHVGALEYASAFHAGGRMIICKVDPADVVCVPNDHSFQKMRVCRYEVVGIHGANSGHMPSTTIDSKELPKKSKGKRSKEFQALDQMDEIQLMSQSTEKLRKYASKGCNIIGASRLPGGKWSLVQTIVKARP